MTRLKAGLAAIGAFLRRTRLKPLLVLTAACLILREQYPFSHFPMYSSFGKSTYYIYLADGAGQPLPTNPTAGMSTPTLKKVFESELRNERREVEGRRERFGPEHRAKPAQRLLTRVKSAAVARGTAATLPPALRLYQVNIRLENGRYDKETILLAEHQ